MVVAVIAVRVVQVTADQVVDVRSVRDRLMTAVRSVLVGGPVLGAVVAGRAVGGVGAADRQRVPLNASLAVVVQLAVMELIAVADGRVAAVRAVLVVDLLDATQKRELARLRDRPKTKRASRRRKTTASSA